MKRTIKINGKEETIKSRGVYAPSERVVQSKKQYNRNKQKNYNKREISKWV